MLICSESLKKTNKQKNKTKMSNLYWVLWMCGTSGCCQTIDQHSYAGWLETNACCRLGCHPSTSGGFDKHAEEVPGCGCKQFFHVLLRPCFFKLLTFQCLALSDSNHPFHWTRINSKTRHCQKGFFFFLFNCYGCNRFIQLLLHMWHNTQVKCTGLPVVEKKCQEKLLKQRSKPIKLSLPLVIYFTLKHSTVTTSDHSNSNSFTSYFPVLSFTTNLVQFIAYQINPCPAMILEHFHLQEVNKMWQ